MQHQPRLDCEACGYDSVILAEEGFYRCEQCGWGQITAPPDRNGRSVIQILTTQDPRTSVPPSGRTTK